MQRPGFVAFAAASLALAGLGAGTLNYTDPSPPAKVAHHAAWAAEVGAPPPSAELRGFGFVALVFGAAAAASALGGSWFAGPPRDLDDA